jgi:hypothetical protein
MVDTADQSGTRRFASIFARACMGLFALIAFCTGVVLLAIFWIQYKLPAAGVPFVVVGTAWLVRALRVSFEVSPEGVVIRNVFRTRRVAWPEIAGIGWRLLTVGMPGGSVPELAVKLGSGTVLTATATAGLGHEAAGHLVDAVAPFASQSGIELHVTVDDLRSWPPTRENRSPMMT